MRRKLAFALHIFFFLLGPPTGTCFGFLASNGTFGFRRVGGKPVARLLWDNHGPQNVSMRLKRSRKESRTASSPAPLLSSVAIRPVLEPITSWSCSLCGWKRTDNSTLHTTASRGRASSNSSEGRIFSRRFPTQGCSSFSKMGRRTRHGRFLFLQYSVHRLKTFSLTKTTVDRVLGSF